MNKIFARIKINRAWGSEDSDNVGKFAQQIANITGEEVWIETWTEDREGDVINRNAFQILPKVETIHNPKVKK